MSSDQLKFKAISLLLNGESPREVEAQIDGVSYSSVLRWQRELKEAQENGSVQDLIDLDKAMLGEVLDEIESRTPAALQADAAGVLEVIGQSATAADSLQQDLIVAAKLLNQRVKSLSMSVESIGELTMLSEVLCNLQNAFFNKNTTQINVQNNLTPGPSYGKFLGDKPND